jgi:hypothetical protein
MLPCLCAPARDDLLKSWVEIWRQVSNGHLESTWTNLDVASWVAVEEVGGLQAENKVLGGHDTNEE